MSFYTLQTEAVSVTTTSQMLVDSNGSRIHFSIENRGSANIYIHFSEEDATTANGIQVRPGELYEPFNPGRSQVHAIAQSGSNDCIVTEG